MTTTAPLSGNVTKTLRTVLKVHILEHARPKIVIRQEQVQRLLDERFDEKFAARTPIERNIDVVLIILGEIAGRLGVILAPEGTRELRKTLDSLLGR